MAQMTLMMRFGAVHRCACHSHATPTPTSPVGACSRPFGGFRVEILVFFVVPGSGNQIFEGPRASGSLFGLFFWGMGGGC